MIYKKKLQREETYVNDTPKVTPLFTTQQTSVTPTPFQLYADVNEDKEFFKKTLPKREIPTSFNPVQAFGLDASSYTDKDNRGNLPAYKHTPIQKKENPNKTGLPDNLKSGIENLSGMSMDDVNVHYNSSKPTQLQAHAYAQGTDIHVASGQEKHLPHEAWHVVQQKQGRVKPTMQMQGVNVNDDKGLEREADVMGGKALQMKETRENNSALSISTGSTEVVQAAMRGAYNRLKMTGGGITHSARAKKVFTLTAGKSTYDKILSKLSAYEKAEAKGKKNNQWFVNQLNALELLCDHWLNDTTHKKEVTEGDIAMTNRANALQQLKQDIQGELVTLGGNHHQDIILIEEGTEGSSDEYQGGFDAIGDQHDFSSATAWKHLSSGNGGAVRITFSNGILIVKSGNSNEIFASRLANAVGMTAPATRKATEFEQASLKQLLPQKGINGFSEPFLIMEFVQGIQMADLKEDGPQLSVSQVNNLGRSMGKWLAFDIMIREMDRFALVSGVGGDNNVNSSNFMIDPQNIEQGFIGIDQQNTGTKGKSVKTQGSIMDDSPMLGYSLGSMLLKYVNPSKPVDEEGLGDIIMKASRDAFTMFEQTMTKDEVEQLADGLDINSEILDIVKSYVGD